MGSGVVVLCGSLELGLRDGHERRDLVVDVTRCAAHICSYLVGLPRKGASSCTRCGLRANDLVGAASPIFGLVF